MRKRRAVITGMGVLAGSTHDPSTLWKAVAEGKSAAATLTRFDSSTIATRIAAELVGFNAADFVSPKVARRMDNCYLYGMVAAQKAIADSRLKIPELAPERVGVLLGTSLGAVRSTLAAGENLRERDYRGTSLMGVFNSHMGSGSAEIAFHLGVHGHAATIGTGSASSNDAIGYGLDMIELDRLDVAIAGGAEAPIEPAVWASMSQGRITSRHNDEPRRAMRPFDVEHDGPVVGEGAAFIVIEEFEHARKRGARMYCEVLAHGRSNEAYHALAPHPEGTGPYAAMDDALGRASIDRGRVSYINAHGTATVANDAAESAAIRRMFGHRVPVSSTKPVTGHLLGAAGAIETIITALAIQHQTLPMTLNFTSPAEGCDLDYVPTWSRRASIDLALNLNCGFGGANSCLVLGGL